MKTIITKIKLYDDELKKSITIKIPLHLQNKKITALKKHYNTDRQKIYWWATKIEYAKI